MNRWLTRAVEALRWLLPAPAPYTRPRRLYKHYAKPELWADGVSADRAAIAAVQARGLPCHIPRTAEAAGLGSGRVAHASMVVKHAPDLIPHVEAGDVILTHAAIVARLRRDAPDLAAEAVAGLTADYTTNATNLYRLLGVAKQRAKPD